MEYTVARKSSMSSLCVSAGLKLTCSIIGLRISGMNVPKTINQLSVNRHPSTKINSSLQTKTAPRGAVFVDQIVVIRA